MMKSMKRKILLTVGIGTLLVFMPSCETPTEPPPDDTQSAIVRGKVIDPNENPLPQAEILATSEKMGTTSTESDSMGNYQITLPLSEGDPTTQYTLTASKPNFGFQTHTLHLAPGDDVLLNFVLSDTTDNGDPPEGTGIPQNIILESVDNQSISVQGTGWPTAAVVVFRVYDTVNQPLDGENSYEVEFSFTGPNGGEFIEPDAVFTDEEGRAQVVLTSGTISGVVQLVAKIEFEIDGTPYEIIAEPVVIVIHGGLPVQENFYLGHAGAPRSNIPWTTAVEPVTAQLGDKFNNPVVPGTAVYFTATAGFLVQAEAWTDNSGWVDVPLWPKQLGFGYVKAHTFGEGGSLVSDSVRVLKSGPPIISVSPTSFTIPGGGSQEFTVTVQDVNGNPMAGGQIVGGNLILPDIEEPKIDIVPDQPYELPDTQDPAYTQFTFTVFNNDDRSFAFGVYFFTQGPNGNASVTATGNAVP